MDNSFEKKLLTYESKTRYLISRKSYTILTINGRNFQKFTKGLDTPFDLDYMELMDGTMAYLCSEIQGIVFGYSYSDEISLLLVNFKDKNTQAKSWFDGDIQKIISTAASLTTYSFSELLRRKIDYHGKRKFLTDKGDTKTFSFIAKVFTVPGKSEVIDYFTWRQKNAIENSISMLAQSMFSYDQVQNKSISELKQMCDKKGRSWDKLATDIKRGRGMYKKEKEIILPTHNNTQQQKIKQKTWEYDDKLPIFSREDDYLNEIIPTL